MIKLDEFGQTMADTIESAESWFVDNFAQNGPVEGGVDGACRYLLAIALRGCTAAEFAKQYGVSEAIAERLLEWLEAGTKL